MKSALILYPNQLFAVEKLPRVDTVVLVEEPSYFGVDPGQPGSHKVHKQKMILLRASMRRYAEEVLWPHGQDMEYIGLDVLMQPVDMLERLEHFDRLYMFDPVDTRLTTRLLEARQARGGKAPLEFLANPNFYLKDQELRQFFGEKHHDVFAEFYQWQRERFNVLLGDNYKPVGGALMLGGRAPHKLPEAAHLPSFQVYGSNKWVAEATEFVGKHFADNPGAIDFIWPTSHAEATAWLNDFVTQRLDKFATYQDTIDNEAAWLCHSAIGSSLNLGLLSPQQVVEAALVRHKKVPVSLDSLEAFIRQVLGWREFVRGVYVARGQALGQTNIFGHARKLTPAWYEGRLGIPPFDDLAKKLYQHAYASFTERLMVAGNLMLLCEIDPAEVCAWFGSLCVDSYDWVVVPNVYGLMQSGNDGSTSAKPSVSSSNYLLQRSNYQRGEWADVWDGLFWRFIEKNQALLSKNPQMRVVLHRMNRLDADRKRIIRYRAEDFLAKSTL